MSRRLAAATFAFALTAGLVTMTARPTLALFPFPADPNRCDSSGLPPGCIALPNEMKNECGLGANEGAPCTTPAQSSPECFGSSCSCNGEKWKYASTNFCTADPTINASANELFGVSGMSIEIAWRLETGRSDVVIAVHDSGIRWFDNGALSDLRKKFHLNAGELPAPAPLGGCFPPWAATRVIATATASTSTTWTSWSSRTVPPRSDRRLIM